MSIHFYGIIFFFFSCQAKKSIKVIRKCQNFHYKNVNHHPKVAIAMKEYPVPANEKNLMTKILAYEIGKKLGQTKYENIA